MLNTHTHTLTHSYTCTLTHTVTHSHTHIYADTCSHIVTHAHTYTHRALESILDFWFLIFYHLLCRSQKPQRWQYCHSSQSWWTQRQYRLCYKKKWYASDSLRDWFKSCLYVVPLNQYYHLPQSLTDLSWPEMTLIWSKTWCPYLWSSISTWRMN